MTEEAAALVRTLGGEPGLGLRIDTRPESHSLRMTLAAAPGFLDTVINEHGARVYLAADVARRLHGQTLTASTHDERAAFYLV